MNESKKMWIIIFMLIAFTALANLLGGDDEGAGGATEQIKAGAAAATDRIKESAAGTGRAEEALDRAEGAISRGSSAAANSAKRIEICQQLADGCFKRNKEALDLIGRIERANK